jgi:hypothetical protein
MIVPTATTSNVAGFALDGSNFHSSIVSPRLMNNCATKRKTYPLQRALHSDPVRERSKRIAYS